jgi:hypothetical protein
MMTTEHVTRCHDTSICWTWLISFISPLLFNLFDDIRYLRVVTDCCRVSCNEKVPSSLYESRMHFASRSIVLVGVAHVTIETERNELVNTGSECKDVASGCIRPAGETRCREEICFGMQR